MGMGGGAARGASGRAGAALPGADVGVSVSGSTGSGWEGAADRETRLTAIRPPRRPKWLATVTSDLRQSPTRLGWRARARGRLVRASPGPRGRSATGPHLASSLRARRRGQRGRSRRDAPILHTADVHLGARHADLGDAATAQRERQFAAFRPPSTSRSSRRSTSSSSPATCSTPSPARRSVERVAPSSHASARRRSAASSSPAPTTATTRVYLPRLRPEGDRRRPPDNDLVTVLPRSSRAPPAVLDRRSTATVFATKRAPYSPLRDVRSMPRRTAATWRIGIVHGALASRTGRTATRSSSRRRRSRRAASTTSRSATGTRPTRARPGRRPRPTRARRSLLPSSRTAPEGPRRLARRRRRRESATVEEAAVGRTRSRGSTSTRLASAASRT